MLCSNNVAPPKQKKNYKAVLFAQKGIYLAASGTARLLKSLHITFPFSLHAHRQTHTLKHLFIDLMHDLFNRIAVLKESDEACLFYKITFSGNATLWQPPRDAFDVLILLIMI